VTKQIQIVVLPISKPYGSRVLKAVSQIAEELENEGAIHSARSRYALTIVWMRPAGSAQRLKWEVARMATWLAEHWELEPALDPLIAARKS
jgi:hypothetical protein